MPWSSAVCRASQQECVTFSLVLNTEIRSLFASMHERKMNSLLIIFPVQGVQAIQFSNIHSPPNNLYVYGGGFGGPDTLGAGLPWPNPGTQLISLSGAPPPQIGLYQNKSGRFSSGCPSLLSVSQFVQNQDGQQVTSNTSQGLFLKLQLFLQLLLPCPWM